MLLLFLFASGLFILQQLLMPSPPWEDARAASLDDANFPRASEADPLPWIIGTVRLRSPNTGWYGNFNSTAITKRIRVSLFKKKTIAIAHRYSVTLDLMLCSGVDVKLLQFWQGKDKITIYENMAPPRDVRTTPITHLDFMLIDSPEFFGGEGHGGGLYGLIQFFSGAFNPPRSWHLGRIADADYPEHGGVCRTVWENFTIGEHPSLGATSYELQRLPNPLLLADAINTNPSGSGDINPVTAIYSIITETWNAIGLTSSKIEMSSFISAAITLAGEGQWSSVLAYRTTSTKKLVSELLRQVDGLMYQSPSTGKLVLKLIREDYTIGDLAVFDPSNVNDIRELKRTSWKSTINQVRVKYKARSRKYDDAIAMAQDMSNVNFQGQITGANLSMPTVYDGDVANIVAWRNLASRSVPAFTAKLICNREAASLNPGDVFKLTWPDYGMDKIVMRVSTVDLGDFVKGVVVVTCMQDRFASIDTLFAPPGDTGWVDPDTGPLAPLERIIFATPYWLSKQLDPNHYGNSETDLSGFYWFLAQRANGLQRSFTVTSNVNDFDSASYHSDDDVEEIEAPYPSVATFVHDMDARYYHREAVIPEVLVSDWSPPLPGSAYELGGRTENQIFEQGYQLCYANGEFMAFENAVYNAGQWVLTNVYRALMDSDCQNHPAGSTIYYISDGLLWMSDVLRGSNEPAGEFTRASSFAQTPLDPTISTVLTPGMGNRHFRQLPPDNYREGRLGMFRKEVPYISHVRVDYRWRDRLAQDDMFRDSDASALPGAGYNMVMSVTQDGVETLTVSPVVPDSDEYIQFWHLQRIRGRGEYVVALYCEEVSSGDRSFYPNSWSFTLADFPFAGPQLHAEAGFELVPSAWVETMPFGIQRSSGYSGLLPKTGQYMLRLITHSVDHGADQEILNDALRLVGALVRFKAHFATSAATPLDGAYFGLEFKSDATTVISSVTSAATVPAVEDVWTRRGVAGFVPPTCDRFNLQLRGTSGGGVIDMSFDDTTFQACMSATWDASPTYDTEAGIGNITFAVGFRLLVSGYIGPLFQIEDGDTLLRFDVYADAHGNPQPWNTSGTAYMVRMYDQTGGGNDIVSMGATFPTVHLGLSSGGRTGMRMEGVGILQVVGGTTTTAAYMTNYVNSVTMFDGLTIQDGSAHTLWAIPHVFTAWGVPATYAALTCNEGADKYYTYDGAGSIRDCTPYDERVGNDQNMVLINQGVGESFHVDSHAISVNNPRKTWTPVANTYPNVTKILLGWHINGGAQDQWYGNFYELVLYDTLTIQTSAQQAAMMRRHHAHVYGRHVVFQTDMAANPPEDDSRYNAGPTSLSGGAGIAGINAKFGTYCLIVTNGHMAIADQPYFDTCGADWSIDFWVRWDSDPELLFPQCLVAHWPLDTALQGWELVIDRPTSDLRLQFTYSNNGVASTGLYSGQTFSYESTHGVGTLLANTYYHITFGVRRNHFFGHLNGVLGGNVESSYDIAVPTLPTYEERSVLGDSTIKHHVGTPITLGRRNAADTLNACIDTRFDEFRFVVDRAEYMEDFPVPTAAYTKPT